MGKLRNYVQGVQAANANVRAAQDALDSNDSPTEDATFLRLNDAVSDAGQARNRALKGGR